jgi:hypothetical protein
MKYYTVLDRKYALLAKIQKNGGDIKGNFVIAKSDNYHKLVSLAEQIESSEALTNMIIVNTFPFGDILWKSKGCIIPPSDPDNSIEFVRWSINGYQGIDS